jgi:anti-sigma factor RsiW
MPALLRAAAAQPGPAGPDCLDEETIAAVVDGALDPAARDRATRHLASCARCRRAVASVLRGLDDPAVSREIAALEHGRVRRLSRFALPLVAAAAVVLFLVWPRTADDNLSRHRAPTITSAAAPVPLAPVAAVAEARVLRWSAVRGADRYHVTLFDAAGRVRYEAQLADTAATLPDSVNLTPGQSYLWNVEARIGWDRWSSSPLTEFSVVGVPHR